MTDLKEVAVVEAVEIMPTEAPEMTGLMKLAITEKVPMEILQGLMEMEERISRRDARSDFFDAVMAFQEECPEIRKSATAKIATKSGSNYGYTFAPLEEITRTIRPILKKHKLSYNWTTEGAVGGILNVVCVLRHTGGHEERSGFPVPSGTTAAMSEAQKMGAALTYGKRQSLTSVLGLTTADVDTDGAANELSEPISDGQADYLKGILHESDADVAKFVKLYKIASVEEMTQRDFGRAVKDIEERNRRKEVKEASSED